MHQRTQSLKERKRHAPKNTKSNGEKVVRIIIHKIEKRGSGRHHHINVKERKGYTSQNIKSKGGERYKIITIQSAYFIRYLLGYILV